MQDQHFEIRNSRHYDGYFLLSLTIIVAANFCFPLKATKKPPEGSSYLKLSKNNHFCPTEENVLWTTTGRGVVTQTHLSRIAQKSLSVLCRVYKHSRTRNLKRAHGVLNAISFNKIKKPAMMK